MKGTNELVVYLDYDGVLHHENCLWHPRRGAYLKAPPGYVLFQHAELLEQTLTPYPEVQIVLSTSWVRQYGVTGSAKRLPPGLRQRVIGATYHTQMDEQAFAAQPRGRQVVNDVLRRKPREWLALDDAYEDWPEPYLRNYVRTHEHLGISDPLVLAELERKLEETCR